MHDLVALCNLHTYVDSNNMTWFQELLISNSHSLLVIEQTYVNI